MNVAIHRDEAHSLNLGLSDEKAIERIAMMPREDSNLRSVRTVHGEIGETACLWKARELNLTPDLELAKGELDRNLQNGR